MPVFIKFVFERVNRW